MSLCVGKRPLSAFLKKCTFSKKIQPAAERFSALPRRAAALFGSCSGAIFFPLCLSLVRSSSFRLVPSGIAAIRACCCRRLQNNTQKGRPVRACLSLSVKIRFSAGHKAGTAILALPQNDQAIACTTSVKEVTLSIAST